MNDQVPLGDEDASRIREPSLLDAIIPVVTLVGLIGLTIWLFGTDATGGPLQVALLTSTMVAGFVALKNGHTVVRVREAVVGGISSALSAVFILLAVGSLIGAWNMSGTIPTVVYYGIGLLSATWFYAATAIVCGLVGLAIGSSWTTAATLGVAFVALAPILGADPIIAAGAVISGAYFGDKMTPISETTVLVPSMVGGVTTQEHIGAMVWTSVPAIVLSILGFAIIGLMAPPPTTAFDPSDAQAILAGEFVISPINLVPMVLLVILSIRRTPPFLAIFGSALFAAVLGVFTQPEAVAAFVGDESAGTVQTGLIAIYSALATGFVSNSGNETIDSLFSRGGMASMLNTIWLVLGALSFAAVMEHAGFLERLIRPVLGGCALHGPAHRSRDRHSDRAERDRRRPVRGDRHAQPRLPCRVREARDRATNAVEDGRGCRHGHLAPGAVEQLWRLHGRGPRRRDRRLPALRVLQPAEPADLAHLRLHRVPHRARVTPRPGIGAGR